MRYANPIAAPPLGRHPAIALSIREQYIIARHGRNREPLCGIDRSREGVVESLSFD